LIRAAFGTVSSIDEVLVELVAAKDVLSESRADGSLYEIANSIHQRMSRERDRLSSNETRATYNDFDEMTVDRRLWHARFAPTTNAYGPTPSQRESYRIARELYDEVAANLTELVDTEYAALKDAMDSAGAPWSPGRGIQ